MQEIYKPKPCPFCNVTLVPYKNRKGKIVEYDHPKNDCFLAKADTEFGGVWVDASEVKAWNTRKECAFDVLDLISCAYHGKRYYFLQDDGTIYSRKSDKYMSFEEAVNEFYEEITIND